MPRRYFAAAGAIQDRFARHADLEPNPTQQEATRPGSHLLQPRHAEKPAFKFPACSFAPQELSELTRRFAPGTVHVGTVRRWVNGKGFVISLGPKIFGFLNKDLLEAASQDSINRVKRVKVRIAQLDERLRATLTRVGL